MITSPIRVKAKPPLARPPKIYAPTKEVSALLAPFVGVSADKIHLPMLRHEFEAAARDLIAQRYIGFDTESKPVFIKGDSFKGPHVVQLATADRTYIFQLYRPGCRSALKLVLESTLVTKVGFGLFSDFEQLELNHGIRPRATRDLDHEFRLRGYPKCIGIRGAVAVMFNRYFHKSKRVSTSNWAALDLSPTQLMYAANDAHVALLVHLALLSAKS